MAITTDDLVSAMGNKLYEVLGYPKGSDSDPYNPAPDVSANEVLLSAISAANSLADSYLSRYALPFSPEPDSIKSAKLDIARYRIISLSRPDLTNGVAGRDEILFEQALKFLTQIRDGKLSLNVPEGTAATNNVNSRAVEMGGDLRACETPTEISNQDWFTRW